MRALKSLDELTHNLSSKLLNLLWIFLMFKIVNIVILYALSIFKMKFGVISRKKSSLFFKQRSSLVIVYIFVLLVFIQIKCFLC